MSIKSFPVRRQRKIIKICYGNNVRCDLADIMGFYTHRDSRSMSSDLDIASGRMRGIAATQVLNRSILGFLSPLSKKSQPLTDFRLILKMKEDKWAVTHLCYIRDHVLWLFVEHLDACEHHTTTHLLVQVSQNIIQRLSYLGVVQGHACGGEKKDTINEFKMLNFNFHQCK